MIHTSISQDRPGGFLARLGATSMAVATLGLSAGLALTAATMAQASVVGVFHENLIGGNNTVFVFGAENTTGTITSGGVSNPFTIDSTGFSTFGFGSAGNEMTQNGVVNNLSFRVDSADPISAIALNRGSASTDQTTLLDIGGLGNDYMVLTTPGVFGSGSQMSVTAVEDNTVVTITSPIALPGNPANTPFQVTLQAGESVFYESGTAAATRDLSGTRVTASRNVAVFAGAECTNVPVGTVACDHLISQQFSTDNFDTDFFVAGNFGGGTDGDLVRVIGATDNTEVFLNGVSQGVINAGQVLEIDNVENGRLTATEPVTVGQFIRGQGGTRTTGDPAFAIIPSVDQLLDSYAYATPVGADSFAQNFLNVAINLADAASLLLNGVAVDTSLFANLNGILFGNVAIAQGTGTISADNPFLATISGFSNFDSYFSPIATAFSPGVSPPPPPPSNPIPLPAAGWLLISGLGGLAVMRRRRKTTTS